MIVDRDVEPVVRKAYAAAVAERPDWFESALEALAARGDDFAARAMTLAVAIDAAALYAIHDGIRPDGDQLAELQESFSENEAWARIDPQVARTFLTAIADHTPVLSVLTAKDIADVTYVMGGWLLAAFLPEDGKDWTDFLDEILDALESAPAP